MPSVNIAPPTKAQTTTAITLKANCSVIFNPFLIKFTLLTPLGYNQITKRNPKGAKTMNIVTVQSSAIAYVGYDEASKIMLVKFHGSKPEYKFCGVPKSVFKELISAPSVGTYYHKHVEGKYLCP